MSAFVTALLVLAALTPSAAAAGLPPLQHLAPGGPADVHQTVPVNVVFVGLEPGGGPTGIDAGRFLAGQVPAGRIVDRHTRAFEQSGNRIPDAMESSAIGLTLDYRYRTVFADAAFEDAFFGYLASISEGPKPGGTPFMRTYSSHPLAAEQIDASFKIDPVLAERWLARRADTMLGIDTTRPTVFLINWYGRSDFRFHTYGFQGLRPGPPFPFGDTIWGQMAAWGGTPPDPVDQPAGPLSRVWFYDLSAGPDFWGANYLLDVPDLDGDGEVDTVIPPIWEYGTSHWARPFDDVTGDLSKLVRYVAVDTLFGASPIYDPAVSEPLLADRTEIDLNLFAGRPGRDPAATLRIGALPGILGRLDRTRDYPVDVQAGPLSGQVSEVYDCNQTAFTPFPESCYGGRLRVPPDDDFVNEATYDLSFYLTDHREAYLDGTRYEIPVAFFDVPDERNVGISGLALNRGNRQDWVFTWMTDRARFQGLKTDTGVLAHEIGHHLGLSHPHDGYDTGLDKDFDFRGPYWFVGIGDSVYSNMSYLNNTDEFGQFDRDNIARWQVAARIDNANRILGDVARSGQSARAVGAAHAADGAAGQALAALAGWDLLGASTHAAAAYRLALQAAVAANVKVEPFSDQADGSKGAGVQRNLIDKFSPRVKKSLIPAELTDHYGK